MSRPPIRQALTFDDVLLEPRRSSILPREVNPASRLTRGIELNIPLVSAAMDTVTEARSAVCLAQEGGVGIVHKNLPIERQAEEVRQVKRYLSGVVGEPITIGPDAPISQVLAIKERYGFSGIPVVREGKPVGIITNRDLRFATSLDKPVSSLMTTNLITIDQGAPLEEAKRLLHQHRIEKLIMVDEAGKLAGLITVKDMEQAVAHPNACKDERGRLRVGAAIGPGPDGMDRFEALREAGVDVVVVDTAHGHSEGVMGMVADIKRRYPEFQVIAGNVATTEAVRDLIQRGADAVKVGIGPGSICTTRMVAGVGVPQITAIMDAVEAAEGSGVPIIADGGIKFSGDIVKALASGASCVMLGGMLAGTDESPGEVVYFQGRAYKSYRGMGSSGAMQKGSKDRYFQAEVDNALKLVPEGVEGRVPYKGPMAAVIHQLVGGIRAGMGYLGAATIADMQQRARFVQITGAGLRESHVHDVQITTEAPNYRLD